MLYIFGYSDSYMKIFKAITTSSIWWNIYLMKVINWIFTNLIILCCSFIIYKTPKRFLVYKMNSNICVNIMLSYANLLSKWSLQKTKIKAFLCYSLKNTIYLHLLKPLSCQRLLLWINHILGLRLIKISCLKTKKVFNNRLMVLT